MKISKTVGFVLGLALGIFTRDNYLYPYPIKVEEIQEDFLTYSDNIGTHEKQLHQTITNMKEQFEKVQGIYMTMKHRPFAEDEDSDLATESRQKGGN
jgi:energy-converting hydrogenase Eha subunit F